MSRLSLKLLAALSALVLGVALYAQEAERITAKQVAAERRERLRGIGDVCVVALWGGYDETTAESVRLKSLIESRLRLFGLTPRDNNASPWLEVGAMFSKDKNGVLYSHVQVTVREWATLVRNGDLVLHETWHSHVGDSMRTWARPVQIDDLRADMIEGIDEFCNDFLAANPKTP